MLRGKDVIKHLLTYLFLWSTTPKSCVKFYIDVLNQGIITIMA